MQTTKLQIQIENTGNNYFITKRKKKTLEPTEDYLNYTIFLCDKERQNN